MKEHNTTKDWTEKREDSWYVLLAATGYCGKQIKETEKGVGQKYIQIFSLIHWREDKTRTYPR